MTKKMILEKLRQELDKLYKIVEENDMPYYAIIFATGCANKETLDTGSGAFLPEALRVPVAERIIGCTVNWSNMKSDLFWYQFMNHSDS